MSYNYSECYDLVYKARNRSRRLDITMPSAVESTMKAESIKPMTSPKKKRQSNVQEANMDMDTKIVIPISFGIVAVTVLILICLVHCLSKEHFLKGFISNSCRFQARQKRSITNENTNTDIESTPLKEVT
ncbi:uncharacterized protein LOC134253910 [Saccostrea cucullata]|uniref:uncharacterized protein LOC134253910 n=1 Tax=Saccostrea cuccullata TaxID=36930 RepID=UPI002ED00B11